MKISSATIQNWILPVAALVAWEIFGQAGMLPRYLSYPSAILAALWELAVSGELWVALAVLDGRLVIFVLVRFPFEAKAVNCHGPTSVPADPPYNCPQAFQLRR